jgi:L-ascorbate metabolism protein UlaG (beta-lactamase superfamily)
MRPLESLLYKSRFHNPKLQSLRILEQTRDDSRPFFLTTPRLPEADQIDWRVPFDSPEVDELFKLDVQPQTLGYIRELLNLREPDEHKLLPLLTKDATPHAERWTQPGVRLRYFNHACVLVEFNGISILTDPWVAPVSLAGAEHLSYKDLPERIDFALITHGHHDHFVVETLLRLRQRIECLVVPRTSGMFYADTSLKQAALQLGFKNVVEMDALDSLKLPGGEIIGAPFFGEHADLAHGKIGYVVRAGHQQILFAADSNCLDRRLYDHLKAMLGPIETVFLGMECVGAPLSWMYGTFLPVKPKRQHDQTRRTKGCNANAAFELLDAVGGRRVYIYAMGREPWLQFGMGLGLADDSPQVRESDSVMLRANALSFVDAQRPFCQFELHLPAN